eukprot:SAG31_NODE_10447_length_1137_cov_1.156069_2_plen_78_part_01
MELATPWARHTLPEVSCIRRAQPLPAVRTQQLCWRPHRSGRGRAAEPEEAARSDLVSPSTSRRRAVQQHGGGPRQEAI